MRSGEGRAMRSRSMWNIRGITRWGSKLYSPEDTQIEAWSASGCTAPYPGSHQGSHGRSCCATDIALTSGNSMGLTMAALTTSVARCAAYAIDWSAWVYGPGLPALDAEATFQGSEGASLQSRRTPAEPTTAKHVLALRRLLSSESCDGPGQLMCQRPSYTSLCAALNVHPNEPMGYSRRRE